MVLRFLDVNCLLLLLLSLLVSASFFFNSGVRRFLRSFSLSSLLLEGGSGGVGAGALISLGDTAGCTFGAMASWAVA